MSTKKTKLLICEPVRSNFSQLSMHFATLARYTLDTWLSHKNKIPNKINNNYFKKINKEIIDEYRYLNMGKKMQSPLDNSIDDPKKIINLVKRYYKISNISFSDAFTDKIIGGLRGKNRFIIAKFLKKYDQYLVDNKVLSGTNLFVEAARK